MQKLILILAILMLLLPLYSSERVVLRIPDATNSMLQRFPDVALFVPGEFMDVVVPVSDLSALQQEFPLSIITQTEAQLKANLVSNQRDIPGYKDYQQMVDTIYLWQGLYPSLMQISVIGEGWGAEYHSQNLPAYQDFQHQIYAIKLSDNVELTEDEPAFYYVGEHHAREPISMEVTLEILEHYLTNYGTDPYITQMINSSEIWFVPLLNPDGHKIVIDQTDIWWRKNIRDNNASGAIETGSYGNGADGVDINRNYGYMWGNISASNDPESVTYHGINPFSEPETMAFKSFLESHPFLAGISYHTYGEYVLFPYGYAHNIAGPDVQELSALASYMASSIPKVNSGTYSDMPSYSLYPVTGSLDDWAYGTRGIFAYTIEMADEFIPPASLVPQICQNHLTAAKRLIARKDSKTLTGHITDANTGTPVSATIWVEGIDDYLVPRAAYKSRPDFGTYYRFLPQGTHTVKFICAGYQTQTHTVQIVASGITTLDIALQPSSVVNQLVTITDYNQLPIPGATLTFVDGDSYISDAAGLISIPSLLTGEYRAIISKADYETLYVLSHFNGNQMYYRLGDSPIFADGFENGMANWYRTGLWGISSSQYSEGSHSLADSPNGNYGNNVNSYARTLSPIDLSGAERVNLQFVAKNTFPSDSDYACLQYSLAGSSVLNTIVTFTGTKPWTSYDINLNYLAGESINLYFHISTNTSEAADGIYIDDIKLFTSSFSLSNGESTPAPVVLHSYPNPFASEVKIVTPSKQIGRLNIYNVKGQKVQSLMVSESTTTWNGKDFHNRDVAEGVYYLRYLQDGKALSSRKILKLK